MLIPRQYRTAFRAIVATLSVFVYTEWRIRRVALDYHVDIDGHYYSVLHRLLSRLVRGLHHRAHQHRRGLRRRVVVYERPSVIPTIDPASSQSMHDDWASDSGSGLSQ
jgi:hypothetical protein